jgi:D-3-phosphoglycerate dehydrogenase
MYKIFITNDIAPEAKQLLEKNFEIHVEPNMTEEELCKVIGNYDALITRSQTKVTRKVIDAARRLKVIGRAGVGVDGIDIPAATARGIIVVNTPEANTIAAAEHTIALMLGMTRQIPQAHQSIMEGRWDRKSFMGIQLLNKTVGIIGVGRVGSNVAKRLQAFDMNTIGYDPYIPEERGRQLGVKLVDLDTLLAQSDYITLHVPLTEETRSMIGSDEIGKMKNGVRIVNACRGAVIDVQALAESLRTGKVASAGIDVFPEEPLKPENNPFLAMKNVCLTPHLGASTREAQVGVAVDVAAGVAAALRGEPVATAVNASPITKHTLSVIKPYFDLCERMGNMGIYLAEGRISQITVEYTGELIKTETAPLTTAVVKGMLSPILQETVNYVNAPGIAERRHMDIREIKGGKDPYFSTAVTVTIHTDQGTHTITGVLFDGKEARIVRIDGYRVDLTPKGYFLLAPHEDKPGMIGQMATILGEAGININGMQVGQTTTEGTNMMAVALEKDIPNDVLLKLKSIHGILDIKVIHCEHQ